MKVHFRLKRWNQNLTLIAKTAKTVKIKFGEILSALDKRTPVDEQRRRESIGPPFSGLKMNKNSEKWRKTDGETPKK